MMQERAEMLREWAETLSDAKSGTANRNAPNATPERVAQHKEEARKVEAKMQEQGRKVEKIKAVDLTTEKHRGSEVEVTVRGVFGQRGVSITGKSVPLKVGDDWFTVPPTSEVTVTGALVSQPEEPQGFGAVIRTVLDGEQEVFVRDGSGMWLRVRTQSRWNWYSVVYDSNEAGQEIEVLFRGFGA